MYTDRFRVGRQKIWRHHEVHHVHYAHISKARIALFLKRLQRVQQNLRVVWEEGSSSQNWCREVLSLSQIYSMNWRNDLTIRRKLVARAQRIYSPSHEFFPLLFLQSSLNSAITVRPYHGHCFATSSHWRFKRHSSRLPLSGRWQRKVHLVDAVSVMVSTVVEWLHQVVEVRLIIVT